MQDLFASLSKQIMSFLFYGATLSKFMMITLMHFADKKLPAFPAVQEDVLQFAERVNEAQRLAALVSPQWSVLHTEART
jgi:hypothetical protein